MACSGWQLSIELIIGSNLPNQVPKSLSSWKRFIPDDVLTFITASLQMLMHRLNFCLVCFTLKVSSSPLSWHLSFASSITFSQYCPFFLFLVFVNSNFSLYLSFSKMISTTSSTICSGQIPFLPFLPFFFFLNFSSHD